MIGWLNGFKQFRRTDFVLRSHLSEGMTAQRKAQTIRQKQMLAHSLGESSNLAKHLPLKRSIIFPNSLTIR